MRLSTAVTFMTIVLIALAVPSMAPARHGGPGQTCDWTSDQDVNADLDPGSTQLTVYYEIANHHDDGDAGSSGEGDVAAGVCVNKPTTLPGGSRFDGGVVEVGSGTEPGGSGGTPPDGRGSDAVVDGDDDNADPSAQSDGYVGVSNFETGDHDPDSGSGGAPDGCSDQGTGSNSGGCVSVLGITQAVPPPNGGPADQGPGVVPTPICGNTTGPSWDDAQRDGCETPEE